MNIKTAKTIGALALVVPAYYFGTGEVLGIPLTPPSTPPVLKCGIEKMTFDRGDCKWNKAKSVTYTCVNNGVVGTSKTFSKKEGKCESISDLREKAQKDCKSVCKRQDREERRDDKRERKERHGRD